MAKEQNHPDSEEQEEPFTPASPTKRTLAWIGLVYAILLLILTTYFYYTGHMLGNLAPLMALPGLIGLGVLSVVSWHTTGTPTKIPALCLATLCWVLAICTIPLAITGLLSNFGG